MENDRFCKGMLTRPENTQRDLAIQTLKPILLPEFEFVSNEHTPWNDIKQEFFDEPTAVKLSVSNLESNIVIKTCMPISLHFFQRNSVMRPSRNHRRKL